MTIALHRWNRDFHWTPQRRPPGYLRPDQVETFDEKGFCVVERAFAPERVAQLAAEIDPWERQVTDFLRTRQDGRLFIAQADAITFSTHLVKRSERLRAFCSDLVFQGITRDLVGPDVRLYWDQAVYKKPERERGFPWHQDNGYTYVEPQQYLTCWVALTDADTDNGCPWVVPGLHLRGTLHHHLTDLGWQCLEDPDGAVPLPVRAGDIAVFSSLTPHATGPNRTQSVRKAYIVQFAPDGACALREGPDGRSPQREPQDAEDRQFLVLRDGQPAA